MSLFNKKWDELNVTESIIASLAVNTAVLALFAAPFVIYGVVATIKENRDNKKKQAELKLAK